MSHYRKLIVETFLNPGEPSSSPLRVRVVAGQGVPANVRVECSKAMRTAYPPGTCFELELRDKGREGTPTLYAHHTAAFKRLTKAEAIVGIAERGRG